MALLQHAPGSRAQPSRRRIVGVSTKMYFSASQTAAYTASFLQMLSSPQNAARVKHILDSVDIFLIPDHVTVASVAAQVRMSSLPVLVGAQDCSSFDTDRAACTGEVSSVVLSEVGCAIVEVGHAERRRRHGETDETTAAKAYAAVRHGLIPLVCIGEKKRPSLSGHGSTPAMAVDIAEVVVQVRTVLAALPDDANVVLAYEPVWAIGAAEPAPVDYVCAVVQQIRDLDVVCQRVGSTRVVYGGSAGPGLFSKLAGTVDGLFLGRFAHDPAQFFKTLCEVAEA